MSDQESVQSGTDMHLSGNDGFKITITREGNRVSRSLHTTSEDGSKFNANSRESEAAVEAADSGSNSPDMVIESQTSDYPSSLVLGLLTVGICLSVFLVSLDRTIITTAIPHITDEFHSYGDLGWYGSAYLITACALQPTYGRIFTFFDVKWSFLAVVAIFEFGSLVCAVAPSSKALIIGRAIAGWGSAGILTGSFVVVAHSVSLQKRPLYTAAVGVMFSLGAVVGPLLGGVFTDLVTWRWCFYFNLPIGIVTAVVIVLFFNPKRKTISSRSILSKILELDLVGSALLLGVAVMFFLALQFGDQQHQWSSPKVIGLLTGSGIAIIMFIGWQCKQGDRALIPPGIILQRSVAAGSLAAFFIYSTMLIHVYYLPIWFQAIKGESAVHSGVSMVAYMIGNALFSLLAGAVVTRIGYFAPPAIVGCAIAAVGCGLLSMLQVNTPSPNWIVYEIVASMGLGMAIQQGFIAVQTVLRVDQLPIGIAAITCFQSLGGAVSVSVGNTILQNELLNAATTDQLPGIDIQAVIAAGATQFRSFIPESALPALLIAYNNALRKVFITAVPLSGLAFFSVLGFEWKSVKAKKSSLEASPETTDGIKAEESYETLTNTIDRRADSIG